MLETFQRLPWLEWLGRSRRFLLILLVAIVAYLSYHFVYVPAWERNQAAKAELEKHRTELAAARGRLAVVEADRAAWEKEQQGIGSEFFAARAVEEQDVVVLSYFYRLQQLARDSGAALLDVNQSAEAKPEPAEDRTLTMVRHGLTMRLRGTYDQLSGFLDRLARSPRLARVDSAVIGAAGGASRDLELTVKATLTFYLPESVEKTS